MDIDEFKKRIEDCRRSIEYADERDLFQNLRILTDLIEGVKAEAYFETRWEKLVMNEINDMDKSEFRVDKKLSKRENEQRLKTFKWRLNLELDRIVHSS